MNRLLDSVDLFVIKDLVKLAELLEVETIAVHTLVNNELLAGQKGKKR